MGERGRKGVGGGSLRRGESHLAAPEGNDGEFMGAGRSTGGDRVTMDLSIDDLRI